MKFGNGDELGLDVTDLQILQTLQRDCKTSFARIGEEVGLSAPSVLERLKKLEQSGVVRGYSAVLDSRALALDVTAFIGVVVEHAGDLDPFESHVGALDEVLECHHVTGQHTLLLKVKTANTSSLEHLISRSRARPGVVRTETMVVLSTHTERWTLPLRADLVMRPEGSPRRRTGRGLALRRGATGEAP